MHRVSPVKEQLHVLDSFPLLYPAGNEISELFSGTYSPLKSNQIHFLTQKRPRGAVLHFSSRLNTRRLCCSSPVARTEIENELSDALALISVTQPFHLVCRAQTAWSTCLQKRERASCIWRKPLKLWRCRRTAACPTTKRNQCLWKKSCCK